ncbi:MULTISPECIES: ABC transporter ATP-binding protein [Vagococcus]|uniref:ABC transporter, ATP-binding protein n=1 Tax=Vagococcus fluvialis bH819 TaxID=1255619 RepID=A0A1X6WL50_9ENTE|nr:MULTISPECIES: ABC transporter ATP-binding protein [Vagococcus]SLM85061.1 ABC transporter, ATP-binding protein [Vagococcus fluvialis bH819]HCM88523.1 ABC transporter ATP-binding protein [Vagococcus sp.]
MEQVMSLKNVTKKFKEKEVLKDISLTINQGECVALLGKNGAGKSTLLNLVLDLFYPTSGEIILQTKKEAVGFLSQKTRFPDDVTIQEMLDFISSFSNNPLSKEEIKHILNFEKTKYKQLIHTCSGGEQRLFDMCLAIINRPKFLIVDEPTAGMDTSTRNHYWDIMKELKNTGTTILFTTHYVEEVDYCADRVILLDNGVIRADNTPYHLRTLNKKKIITIEKENYSLYEEKLKEIEKNYQIRLAKKADVVTLEFQNEASNQIITELLAMGLSFDNVEVTNTSLLNTIFANELEEEVK